ncbi:hypothetical protein INT45_004608 [Circinella minor]|uniref:Uncharacterized protein n=1 Tax=Circinella minor TaxID=1195481 RepID=A0A8H7VNC4_9FUNG|nr:hypothetical protein INT45_004608 [Circinella minor]
MASARTSWTGLGWVSNGRPVGSIGFLLFPGALFHYAWAQGPKAVKEKSIEDKFLAFRQFSARCASSGDGAFIESHIYELLTLNALYTELLQPLYGEKQTFDPTLASLVSDAVYCYTQSTENIGANSGALMECSRKLILMSADRPRCEASVLFGLGNLLHKLPIRTMMEGVVIGETELWSSAFDPIFSPILSNPENQVILSWSNVILLEGRPIPHIVSLGFGEVKLRESKPNLDALGCDLLRLADLTQHASAELNASFSFQIHGYNLKAYITTTISNTSITSMLEILSLEFPKSVEDLHSFVSRQSLDKLVRLHKVFWNNCLQEKNDGSSQESTLDIAVLHAIKQSSPDRSRKNTNQY